VGCSGRHLLLAAILLAALLQSAPSQGQPEEDLARASAAFDRGLEAQKQGEWAEAARHFGDADAIVADPAALEAALAAVLRSDDAVLGMELAARADRNPYRDQLTELAASSRRRFGQLVGRIVVHCDDCTVAIDGRPTRRGVAVWVTTGAHRVTLGAGGEEEHREVHVDPGGIVTLVPLRTGTAGGAARPAGPVAAARGPTATVDEGSEGLPPAFFWIGLGLTAAAGGGAIASAVDTRNKHEAFSAAPTPEASINGQNAETRTNVLLAVTGGLGLTTAILGIVAVDWGDDGRLEGSLVLTPQGPRGWATLRF